MTPAFPKLATLAFEDTESRNFLLKQERVDLPQEWQEANINHNMPPYIQVESWGPVKWNLVRY